MLLRIGKLNLDILFHHPQADRNHFEWKIYGSLLNILSPYNRAQHHSKEGYKLDTHTGGSVLWKLYSSVRSSVRLQCKISEFTHRFFLIFSVKLDSHKVRKLAKPNSWKKWPVGSGEPKSHILTQKWGS